jgi:RHS repeat-associated protein
LYSYDALGRRIIINPGTPRDLYYSSTWQVLEEQVGGVMQVQYLWSPVYVDALIERDTASGQRLYVQQDANWNVTAILDSTGAVQERYVYDPYGRFTDPTGQTAAVLAPDWSVRGSTLFGWVYLHQGVRYDSTTGLYHFRRRDYSPTLGRWMQLDVLQFTKGETNTSDSASGGETNTYDYENDDPTGWSDPFGLPAFWATPPPVPPPWIATWGPPGIAVGAGVTIGVGLSYTPPFQAAGGWIGDTIADWWYGAQLREAAKPIPRPWPDPKPWPEREPRPRPPESEEKYKCCTYRCDDGLPYYRQYPSKVTCPGIIVANGQCCRDPIASPGPCPPNLPRPLPN